MRAKWRKSISVIVSFGLVVSSMAFTGDFGTGSTARAVETEVRNTVDTESEFTDEATGCKYKLYNQNRDAQIIGYAGEDGNVVIPAKIGPDSEYTVKQIAKEAFKESEITSVTIEEGIEFIGYQAFAECKKLESVKIPSTIKTWKEEGNYENAAFRNCVALTTLELADGLTTLGQEAFRGCKELTSVKIPGSITTFQNRVFEGCSKLVNVELEEGITAMGYQAFRECTSLEEVKIPSTIKTWCTVRSSGVMAQVYDCGPFYACTSLKKVTFAEGLTTLFGFQGVRGCPQVKELDIPASVTNIDRAFSNCEYLEKVTLHDGLESIGQGTFEECSALKELLIPDSVTSLGYRALYKCTSLEKLVLPSNLTAMDDMAVTYCSSLKEVYILSQSMPYKGLGLTDDGKYYCIAGSDTYSSYLAKKPENTAVIPTFSGIEAGGYSAVYDGESHNALAQTSGVLEGDSVRYRIDGADEFQSDIPKIKEPGEYNIEILVIRAGQNETIQVGVVNTTAEIRKKESSIQLKNTEVTGGEYTMTPESYVGDEDAEIIYSYYKDALLSVSCDKPTEPGVYYVKATVDESEYYLAGESNVVTLTIKENSQSTQEPSQQPTQKPTQKPTQTPGLENSPSPTPAGGTQVSSSPSPAASMTPAPTPTSKPQKTPEVKVKKVTVKKVKSPSKKKIEVQWKKVSGVTGYQVIVGLDKKFKKGKKTVTVKGASKTKAVVKNLKRKKLYYVKVRAYKNVNGVKKCGKWSSVGKIKVK